MVLNLTEKDNSFKI